MRVHYSRVEAPRAVGLYPNWRPRLPKKGYPDNIPEQVRKAFTKEMQRKVAKLAAA
jgi:hypothetical protein